MPLTPETQVFTVDAAGFVAGVDAMLDSLAKLSTAIADIATQANDLTVVVTTGQEEVVTSFGDVSKSVEDQAAAIKGLQETWSASVDEMILKNQQLAASMTDVKGSTAKTDEEAATAGSGLLAFSKTGVLAFFAVAAGAGLAVDAASKYQASVTRLHTQAGVMEKDLPQLSDGMLKLASQVGFSPNSLAQALYHVESAFQSTGIKGSEALNILTVAAEGTKIGDANLIDVTNALDATMVAHVAGIKNASQAMGVLNAIVGTGDMTMENLAQAMSTGVLGYAALFGQSIEQVGAALAVFGDNNIRGAKAGTDLRMAMQALQEPIDTAGTALAQLNLTSTQLGTTLTHQGLEAAIGQFISHLKASKVPISDWGQYITEIFGKRAGVGIGILVDQFARLQSKFPDLEKSAHNFGGAWAATQKTLSQAWANMKEGLDALAVHFGQILLPVVTKCISAVAKFFGWLEKHPAFAAIAGGILIVVAAAGALSLTLGAISAIGFPELIAVAVVALGVALYECYKHCKTFRDAIADVARFFKSAWDDAVKIAGKVITWFTDGPLAYIRQQLAVFTQFWDQNHREIMRIVEVVWKEIETFIKVDWDEILGVLKIGLIVLETLFKVAWDVIRIVVKTVWDVLATVISTGIKVILDAISIFLDLLQGHWSAAWDKLKDLVRTALNGAWTVIKDIFNGWISLLYTVGRDIISGLIRGVESMFGSVGSVFSDLASHALGVFKSVLSIFSPSQVFHQQGQMIGQGLANGITASTSTVTSAMRRLASSAGLGLGLTGAGGSSLGLGGAGIGGASQTQIHLTVNGFVGNEQQLTQQIYLLIQKAALQANRRNATNGLSLRTA